MKNLLTALLPALALLALGGCAGTSALTSSEDDGVYYSSKDRTTAIVSAAPAPTGSDEAANPDYNGNTGNSPARRGSGSDQYYDNSYTYMRGAYGPGLSYYAPYSPYTTLSYGVSSYYGWGGGACGFSPYGLCDPFYSPFGYGSGISINIGIGRPWGYGGYGGAYGYGRPYGYGYGGGFYDPYYYSSPYYGGYYGRGGYYGSGYGYSSGNVYNGNGNGYNGSTENGRYRTSGHLTDRASDGRYTTGGGVTVPSSTPGSATGGRGRDGGMVAAPAPANLPQTTGVNGGRARSEGAMPNALPGEAINQPQRMNQSERSRDQVAPGNQPVDASPAPRNEGRGRWRTAEAQLQNDEAQPNAAPQPEPRQRRRGGFQDIFSQPRDNSGQAVEQPTRQRSYDEPRPQRTYEQPQQRSYDQPQQQQRSYEQPQRSYSSPSAPSYGGSGGGGNSGGGGHGHSRE